MTKLRGERIPSALQRGPPIQQGPFDVNKPRAAGAVLLTTLTVLSTATQAAPDWGRLFESARSFIGENPDAVASLNPNEVVAGLREALAQGTRNAILSLGKEDGYLARSDVRIPLPASLQNVESQLRRFGMGGAVDEFSLRINRAAEAAVPEAADIFAATIQQLTIEDAMSILNGDDDAATRYFERTTRSDLQARFRPLVERATDQAGVTQSFKALAQQAGPLLSMLAGPGVQDLDGYVTDEALNGLFHTLAQEEQKIRDNPAARSTELLQRVFGAQ